MKDNSLPTLIWLGFAVLAMASGCDDVRTVDQAIAAAKQVCDKTLSRSPPQTTWEAIPGFKKALGDGWVVNGEYDASKPGSLGIVNMDIFVPRNGKPTDCVPTIN